MVQLQNISTKNKMSRPTRLAINEECKYHISNTVDLQVDYWPLMGHTGTTMVEVQAPSFMFLFSRGSVYKAPFCKAGDQ